MIAFSRIRRSLLLGAGTAGVLSYLPRARAQLTARRRDRRAGRSGGVRGRPSLDLELPRPGAAVRGVPAGNEVRRRGARTDRRAGGRVRLLPGGFERVGFAGLRPAGQAVRGLGVLLVRAGALAVQGGVQSTSRSAGDARRSRVVPAGLKGAGAAVSARDPRAAAGLPARGSGPARNVRCDSPLAARSC